MATRRSIAAPCDDILEAVFQALNWRDLCRAICVSQSWRRVALRNPALWRDLDLASVPIERVKIDRVGCLVARAQGGLRTLDVGSFRIDAATAVSEQLPATIRRLLQGDDTQSGMATSTWLLYRAPWESRTSRQQVWQQRLAQTQLAS